MITSNQHGMAALLAIQNLKQNLMIDYANLTC